MFLVLAAPPIHDLFPSSIPLPRLSILYSPIPLVLMHILCPLFPDPPAFIISHIPEFPTSPLLRLSTSHLLLHLPHLLFPSRLAFLLNDPSSTPPPPPPFFLLFPHFFLSFLLVRSRGDVLHAVARCHGGEHNPLGIGFARRRQNHNQGHRISSRHVGCQCVDCGGPVPSAQDRGQGDCLRA
jgi:hypothetical protein